MTFFSSPASRFFRLSFASLDTLLYLRGQHSRSSLVKEPMRLPIFPALSLATLSFPGILATEAPAALRVAPRHVVNKVPHSFEGRWVHGRYRMLPPVHKRGATKADLQPRAPAPSKKPTVNSFVRSDQCKKPANFKFRMFGVIQVASPGGTAFLSPSLR